jgi:hypothetical protein
MTVSDSKTTPNFFNEDRLDPVSVATGGAQSRSAVTKKKAGFYLSETLLDRFNRKFHQLKLDGAAIENKSALAELALHFALDDIDQGSASRLLKRLANR